MIPRDASIYVAGGDTLLGRALLRILRARGFSRVLGEEEPDLRDAGQVEAFFREHRPEYVFVAAGRSGGIAANQRFPADLMLDNLLVAANLLPAAHRHGARRLLYLGSSCSYPREAAQPISEASLLTGPVEPTSEAYALAKIAGLKLTLAYRQQHDLAWIAAIPANLFGPGDDFSPEESHVIGALMRRMHAAREAGAGSVEIWGTGTPRREFLYADDAADACLLLMERYDEPAPVNLGTGSSLSIRELAEQIRDVVGFPGELRFDTSKPDGAPLKSLDGRALAGLGWSPKTPFYEALARTYEDFLGSAFR